MQKLSREILIRRIMAHMGWDEAKANLWFSVKNPFMGYLTADYMIESGRIEKLSRIIDVLIEESIVGDP